MGREDKMSTFRDTEHFYRVLSALMARVAQEKEIASKLVQAGLIVRFTVKDPEAAITVDLRQEPITFFTGESDLKPDVEFIQSADTSHAFWLGRLNVPRAIATRKVIARGSVPKSLALLPAIRPVYSIYEQVLRDLGEESLIPVDKPRRGARRKGWLSSLLQRKRKTAVVDYGSLNSTLIPIVDAEPDLTIPIRPQDLPRDENALKKEMFGRMVLIRTLEERLADEFAAGTVPSEALHLTIGQEACAVGACFALDDGDYMASTHRGHGHLLAKGAELSALVAELFGKKAGLCKGLGGCMHATDAGVGALGANGIVGASSLIAMGAAMSESMRGGDRVALAFMGDGATAQGMFHEALNFAAVFDLPVIFFVENNQYAEFTPVKDHCRLERLSDRAAGYGVPGETVDGNDVWAVYQTVLKAADRARTGGGPTLIEGVTYRWCGHTQGESVQYRTDEEIELWKTRDPIAKWKNSLVDTGVLTRDEASAVEKEAQREVDGAVEFSITAPEPDLEDVRAYVYSPDPAELHRASDTGDAVREVSVSGALQEALAEELTRDPATYLIGEDVRGGGYFAVTAGLAEQFGPERIIDTPISEYAIVGSCVGASMTGMRPIAEIQFSDFITCCMDPLVNQAAKLRFMSGGQYSLPLVVRTPGGGGIGMAAQHSQSLESWLMHIPGLIVIAAGTPHDAKGLLKAAIRSNNPVIFFENKLLYAGTGRLPQGEYTVPIGKADIKRPGEDVTLVAVGAMVGPAVEAAQTLEREGISVEIVDPRTLAPCDWETIVRSAAKTGRVVVAEGGVLTGGFGAECAARVSDLLWGSLKGPVKRVAAEDLPIPYNRTLENRVTPDVTEIVAAVTSLMR